MHVITGASDIEMQCDGDFHTKEERYDRSLEYIAILRRIWSSTTPVDHNGRWYRFNGGFAEIKPVNGSIPVFFGGMSPAAIATGAACADVFATLSDTVAGMTEVVQKVTAVGGRRCRAGPPSDGLEDLLHRVNRSGQADRSRMRGRSQESQP